MNDSSETRQGADGAKGSLTRLRTVCIRGDGTRQLDALARGAMFKSLAMAAGFRRGRGVSTMAAG